MTIVRGKTAEEFIENFHKEFDFIPTVEQQMKHKMEFDVPDPGTVIDFDDPFDFIIEPWFSLYDYGGWEEYVKEQGWDEDEEDDRRQEGEDDDFRTQVHYQTIGFVSSEKSRNFKEIKDKMPMVLFSWETGKPIDPFLDTPFNKNYEYFDLIQNEDGSYECDITDLIYICREEMMDDAIGSGPWTQ